MYQIYSVVGVLETQKGGSCSANTSTMVENDGSGSAKTSIMVENSGSGSAKTSTRTLVDFEGFQPVGNQKKKQEFFQQTLTIEQINEYYDKKEQELMDLLSGIENKLCHN